MMALLVFREKLRSFYGKYDAFCIPLLKFGLGLTVFLMLNVNVGFMAKLKNPVVSVVLALACSFLPYGVISFLAGLVLLGHISSVSLEMALILAVLLVMVAILYYAFQPGDSYLLLLTPVFFYLKIPYAIPLLAGLSGGIAGAIPVSCGAFMYYVMQYVKQNVGVLTNDTSADVIQKYVQLVRTIVFNNQMLLMIAACAAGIMAVYLIKLLSVDYAWHIAIVTGALVQLAVIFIGDFVFDISSPIVELLAGTMVSVLIALVYNFFILAVDYSRTEYLQFQDDDYYYYVKAVPKITVSAPDVKVQKINSSKNRRNWEFREFPER